MKCFCERCGYTRESDPGWCPDCCYPLTVECPQVPFLLRLALVLAVLALALGWLGGVK